MNKILKSTIVLALTLFVGVGSVFAATTVVVQGTLMPRAISDCIRLPY
ncbi:hypothetical protein KBC70_04810 [Candidatus Woesebacteria bacterium]|nr:hypothetical protein [Candidatus Woesebacteria bacterium]